MITEEQARDAADRLKLCVAISRDANDNRRPEVAVYGCDNVGQAIHLCQEDCLAIAAYFAQREADRIERGRPIDADWCLANGGEYTTARRIHFACGGRDEIEVSFSVDSCSPAVFVTGRAVFVGRDSTFSNTVTRGQLLDLLAALKGGAS